MQTEDGERVAVIGLGYVGLPVALAMSTVFDTVGFDTDAKRVASLQAGIDVTHEVELERLTASQARLSTDPSVLGDRSFIIVTVPTPLDEHNRPDLTALIAASQMIAKRLARGAVVVYESTVYPGVTEDICGPLLEQGSGLVAGRDFFLGYSPERINPGDKEHTFERITKVVSGQDEATLKRVAAVYGAVVQGGIHLAPSIKVAEAAKVIENTQRDVNIALMNELSVILDLIGVRTADALAAARTKWNFLDFRPGLVGGHCIGVDPYYLTTRAEALGYRPELILAGRRVNERVGAFIARKVAKLLGRKGLSLSQARIGILGITFKENVPDQRNSKMVDIVRELEEYGVRPLVHDPLADAGQAKRLYGLDLSDLAALRELDVLIYAVPHVQYEEMPDMLSLVKPGGLVVDVKSRLDPREVRDTYQLDYWSL